MKMKEAVTVPKQIINNDNSGSEPNLLSHLSLFIAAFCLIITYRKLKTNVIAVAKSQYACDAHESKGSSYLKRLAATADKART